MNDETIFVDVFYGDTLLRKGIRFDASADKTARQLAAEYIQHQIKGGRTCKARK